MEEKMLDRRKGASPLYHQLERILKEKIETGEYEKGSLFPSERELMEKYDVSRITVRQAMNELARSSYIHSQPGKGTVVVFSKINEKLKEVVSFSDEMKMHGIIMSTKLCEVHYEKADSVIIRELGVENDEVFVLKRVRCADNIPLVYSISYFSKIWGLKADSSLYMESLYKYLKTEKGVIVKRAIDTLEAASADKEIATYLEIQEGSPVFKRVRKSYSEGDDILEYSVCYYRADKYKYTVEL